MKAQKHLHSTFTPACEGRMLRSSKIMIHNHDKTTTYTGTFYATSKRSKMNGMSRFFAEIFISTD